MKPTVLKKIENKKKQKKSTCKIYEFPILRNSDMY